MRGGAGGGRKLSALFPSAVERPDTWHVIWTRNSGSLESVPAFGPSFCPSTRADCTERRGEGGRGGGCFLNNKYISYNSCMHHVVQIEQNHFFVPAPIRKKIAHTQLCSIVNQFVVYLNTFPQLAASFFFTLTPAASHALFTHKILKAVQRFFFSVLKGLKQREDEGFGDTVKYIRVDFRSLGAKRSSGYL